MPSAAVGSRPFMFLVAASVLAACGVMAVGADAPSTTLKSQRFDTDPGWDEQNNRLVPERRPTVVQDFGYSQTNIAGQAVGELGGRVTRASEPAFYADRIGPLTLDDRLSAAGSFAFNKTTPGGGVFLGFFRARQPGAGGRPMSSLGLDFDCEASGARLAVRLITARNQSCGTFITPFIPGKFRPTPLRNDGTRYAWKLDYDPRAADGRGRFTFTIHGDAPQPGTFTALDIPEAHKEHARARFPEVTTFSVDLPAGFRQQGTTFDHFGLMNLMKPGGSLAIFCDDLEYNGRRQDFSRDPAWDASGNRSTYQAKDVPGAHDFGFSLTNYAGGAAGEIGGTFWRSGKYAYYADRVGSLSLDQRLEASGKVVLRAAGPDSDMFLGWFNSASGDTSPTEAGNFLGVHVGGPTRVGHYFHPSMTTAVGTRAQAEAGPLLVPETVYNWSLVYDPDADEGRGTIRVALGSDAVTLHLKPGIKGQGGHFDRFGLFTSNVGGQIVRIYLDDLCYTAGSQ